LRFRKATGGRVGGDRRDPLKVSATGEQRKTSRLKIPKPQSTIHAELTGSDTATAVGLTACGHAPTLRLCRELLLAGFDGSRPLYCYRDTMLCLIIRSIGEAAHIKINSKGTGFVRCRLPVRIAPPVARSEVSATTLAGPV
jgi:hypothetical protein